MFDVVREGQCSSTSANSASCSEIYGLHWLLLAYDLDVSGTAESSLSCARSSLDGALSAGPWRAPEEGARIDAHGFGLLISRLRKHDITSSLRRGGFKHEMHHQRRPQVKEVEHMLVTFEEIYFAGIFVMTFPNGIRTSNCRRKGHLICYYTQACESV